MQVFCKMPRQRSSHGDSDVLRRERWKNWVAYCTCCRREGWPAWRLLRLSYTKGILRVSGYTDAEIAQKPSPEELRAVEEDARKREEFWAGKWWEPKNAKTQDAVSQFVVCVIHRCVCGELM